MKSLDVKMVGLLAQYNIASIKDSQWINKVQAFVSQAVSLAPDMPAWEIGNEVEQTWWGGPMSTAQYMQFLIIAHDAIKAVNPNAITIGLAVACNSGGAAYLQDLINRGALNYLDALSCHYYSFYGQTDFAAIENVVSGARPIWITEFGSTTASVSESQQNRYLISNFDRKTGTLSNHVQVLFWYELNDIHYPPTSDDGWGLTYGPDRNYLTKITYNTFKGYLSTLIPTATPTPNPTTQLTETPRPTTTPSPTPSPTATSTPRPTATPTPRTHQQQHQHPLQHQRQ